MSAPVYNEAANVWLNDRPDVRAMIPAWAESVEAEFDSGKLYLTPGIIHGEVEVSGTITVNKDGSVVLERPTVYLPGDTRGWHLLSPAALVTRLREISTSLATIADAMTAEETS